MRLHVDRLVRFGNGQFESGDSDGGNIEVNLSTVGRSLNGCRQFDLDRMLARLSEQQSVRPVARSFK